MFLSFDFYSYSFQWFLARLLVEEKGKPVIRRIQPGISSLNWSPHTEFILLYLFLSKPCKFVTNGGYFYVYVAPNYRTVKDEADRWGFDATFILHGVSYLPLSLVFGHLCNNNVYPKKKKLCKKKQASQFKIFKEVNE